MKARKSTVVAVCFVLLGTATSAQAAAHLYASTVWGTLYDLNPATGQATNPRDTGTVHLVDIEVDSDGTMYGLTSWGGQPPNSLVRINPAAGDATLVGATGLNSIYEGDLALDPATGQLYGASDYSGGDLRLFRIDKNSGAATVVGAIPYFGDFSGLAFDRDGNLFTIDTDSRLLFKLDKNNAGILVQVPLTGFHGSITAGMAADPTSGIMYVASGDVPTSWLYSLATDTGVLTTVANTNVSGWAGLTFAPPPPAAIGDMNCDGVVDFDDIDPFMLALMDHDAYVAAYPGCDYYNGDCSGNGYVDFGDINCFVALLSGSNRVDLGDVAVGGNGNGSAAPGLGVSVQPRTSSRLAYLAATALAGRNSSAPMAPEAPPICRLLRGFFGRAGQPPSRLRGLPMPSQTPAGAAGMRSATPWGSWTRITTPGPFASTTSPASIVAELECTPTAASHSTSTSCAWQASHLTPCRASRASTGRTLAIR